MFRDLIPLLADRFHIVAPDLPGFGQSDMPARRQVQLHVRQHRASRSTASPRSIGLDRFAVYVFDYGAPTGFRHRREASGPDHRDHLAERQRL